MPYRTPSSSMPCTADVRRVGVSDGCMREPTVVGVRAGAGCSGLRRMLGSVRMLRNGTRVQGVEELGGCDAPLTPLGAGGIWRGLCSSLLRYQMAPCTWQGGVCTPLHQSPSRPPMPWASLTSAAARKADAGRGMSAAQGAGGKLLRRPILVRGWALLGNPSPPSWRRQVGGWGGFSAPAR